MLSRQYRGLYFYHLKKTAGSTLSPWLDTVTADERVFDPAWVGPALFGHWQIELNDQPPSGDPEVLRALFYWSDVIQSHKPLRPFAPAGTLCMTVLRDPVQRLVSQVTDYRRLTPADWAETTGSFRDLIADTNRLPLRNYLERYGHNEGRLLLDNHMTRSLAVGRLGPSVVLVEDAGTLLDAALSSLENDYDVIGLTEYLDISRNALCAMAGWPPAGEIRRLNCSRGSQDHDPAIAEASGILHSLTRFDRIVYERASALFEDRHRAIGETYDMQAFETGAASSVLHRLSGTHRDGATFFSVRLPIMGSGFHGRDDAGKPTCAVWSGPATCLTLYMPTPPNVDLSLLVWIRGYAAERQRHQIQVRVDGQPAPHNLVQADGYADLLTIDSRTERGFVRLEIEIDQTLTSVEAGSEGYDERKRGFSFDGYGWRLLPSDDPDRRYRTP
jgi:hypothetical protein